MKNTTIDDLLHERGLKKTKLRTKLLLQFLNAKHALSYLDIREQMGPSVDKSTLYRNLSAFEDAGLLHKINDHSGLSKYAFGTAKAHNHGHAHFVCEKCETVFCVDSGVDAQIQVPEGFTTKNVQTIITGVCADC